MSWSSVFTGVMTMVHDLWIETLEILGANVTTFRFYKLSTLLLSQFTYEFLMEHVVQPLGFFFDVVTKLHPIFAPIESQWILNFSICKLAANAKSGRNMLINLFGIWINQVRARTFYLSKN